MIRHRIDIDPMPKEQTVQYINEPGLVDGSIWIETEDQIEKARLPEAEEDNVRIYVPLDLNAKAILRRLDYLIDRYEEANERNESDFNFDVSQLVNQIEIYDCIWLLRNATGNVKEHSSQARKLVAEFIQKLDSIPDGCAECFPFEMIEELKKEYL